MFTLLVEAYGLYHYHTTTGVYMADESSASATGGLLVILGIVVALVVGFVLYQQGVFGSSSGPTINVELPAK